MDSSASESIPWTIWPFLVVLLLSPIWAPRIYRVITLIPSIVKHFFQKRFAPAVTTVEYGTYLGALLDALYDSQVAYRALQEALDEVEQFFSAGGRYRDEDHPFTIAESKRVPAAESWNRLNGARVQLEGVKPEPRLRDLHRRAWGAARAAQEWGNAVALRMKGLDKYAEITKSMNELIDVGDDDREVPPRSV